MTPGPRANSHQVAIGLCILMLGVCLVLDRVGLIPASETLRYWPIGLIIIGLSVVAQAFRDTSQVRHSVPWGAIFLLLIVGFVGTRVFERRSTSPDSSESASIFAVLGGDRRAGGPGFRSASITAVMGGAQLDLRNVQPPPGQEITVDVFNLMGGSVIYAPLDWVVDVRAVSVMGGINDQRRGGNGRRRGGFDGGVDVDFGGPAPIPPIAPIPPMAPGAPDAPAAPQPPTAPLPPTPPAPPTPPGESGKIDVEAETPPAAPPRLIIRGFVGMGGLVIKSV
jgi:hypothetical protein